MFSPLVRAVRRALLAGLMLMGLVALPVSQALQVQTQVDAGEGSRKIKKRVAPEYPELARKANMKGVARVQITVTAEGNVKDVKELGGNPVLVDALMRAVKQWKYEPAPKESVIEVKAEFGS